MSVTRLGVVAADGVATMDNPASHQGTATARGEESDVFLPRAGEEQRPDKQTKIERQQSASQSTRVY